MPRLGHAANLPTVGGVVSLLPSVRTEGAEAERLGDFSKASGKKIHTQAWLQTELWNPSSQTGVRLCVHVHTRVYSLGGAAFSGRRRHFPRVFH